MKKLLLVALFVAIPALVLAQATTTTSPAKAEVKKVESTTATTKATEPTKEAAKTTTKTEAVKTATTTTPTTPEMVLIGEITDVDNTNNVLTFKVKETNKLEKISFKEKNLTWKNGVKGKLLYERLPDGKLNLKKFEETKF